MTGPENTLYAVDMDRTLLDTNKAFDLLVEVSGQEAAVDTDELRRVETEVKASAGSFDVMKYLRHQGVDDTAMKSIYNAFSAEGNPENLLYDDAKPFLESVMGNCVIVTTGGREWQRAKLQAVGLDPVPHIITPIKEKGHLVRGWYDGEDYGVVSDNGRLITGDTVGLVDDKAAAFEGLPEDCLGYWLVRGAVLLDSQSGDIPQNVSTIASLGNIKV